MPTTYVRCTTGVDAPVDLALTTLGPNVMGAKLSTSSLPATTSKTEIMSIFRMIDSGLYILDISMSIGGTYIASAQIMMRGHSPGSMIWWRWRTATVEVGQWFTDRTSHQTTVTARGKTYTLTLTGEAHIGYDDLNLSLVA